MLRLYRSDSQWEGGSREVYGDDLLDLVVWYGEKQSISGFQLSYGPDPHAVTWWKSKGLFHNRIDVGDFKPGRHGSPILERDGVVPHQILREEFSRRSGVLSEELRSLVVEKIEGFSEDERLG